MPTYTFFTPSGHFYREFDQDVRRAFNRAREKALRDRRDLMPYNSDLAPYTVGGKQFYLDTNPINIKHARNVYPRGEGNLPTKFD